MSVLKRPALFSLAALILLLLVAVIRQLHFGNGTMVHFAAAEVTLGGESDPVLQTLRQQQTPDSDKVSELLVTSADYQPEKRLFIARHEVTNNEYGRFLNQLLMQPATKAEFAHPSTPADHNFRPKSLNDIKYNGARQPVVNVSWFDAYAFCRFSNMRLPTAAEFEAAMQLEVQLRQASELDLPIGLSSDQEQLVPLEVGKFKTRDGVFQELIGNVMEWVQPEQGKHFLMGYSYKENRDADDAKPIYPWKRHYTDAKNVASDFGFRCVYQAPDNFTLNPHSLPSIEHNDLKCWRTRDNIGINQFALLNQRNRIHYGGGQLMPDELCELPSQTYQLGPDPNSSTVSLIQQNPWGYANYLLGKPTQKVKLDSYWIDSREVSVIDYHQFLNRSRLNQRIHSHPEEPLQYDHTPLNWNAQLTSKEPSEPVTGVSWWGAFAYCNWQNKRLPFAQEWENAARSKDGRLYAWGNDYNAQAKDQTPEGVSNLTRNVSEWTATFILGSDTAVVKGGSTLFDWQIFGRAYVELKVSRNVQSPAIGFRCAR